MFGKINVLPIISGHIRTLCSGESASQSRRVLKRDIAFFYIVPVAIAATLSWRSIAMPDKFVDFLIVTFTIFIPLLVNVLFSVFSIQARPDSPRSDPFGDTSRRLLADIYLNLSYSIVVAFAAVGALGLTKLIDQPRAIDMPESFWSYFNPIAVKLIWCGAYFLTIHLALTLLMIVKRTHVLLGNEYLSDKT